MLKLQDHIAKKNLFGKKSLQLICADKIFTKVCGNVFKISGFRDIKLLVILLLRKIALHSKIISKTRTTKNEKNSALKKIISQIILKNFCKIGLNRK